MIELDVGILFDNNHMTWKVYCIRIQCVCMRALGKPITDNYN